MKKLLKSLRVDLEAIVLRKNNTPTTNTWIKGITSFLDGVKKEKISIEQSLLKRGRRIN